MLFCICLLTIFFHIRQEKGRDLNGLEEQSGKKNLIGSDFLRELFLGVNIVYNSNN